MSLVAYTASSDEDSDYDEETNEIPTTSTAPVKSTQASTLKEQQNVPQAQASSKSLKLPQPKNIQNDETKDVTENVKINELKLNLPAPKSKKSLIIEEEDDEFLRKKVQPSLVEKPKRQPVKITIPSLSKFDDDDFPKAKNASIGPNPAKQNSLLGMLPPPRFNGTFTKPKETQKTDDASASTTKPTVTKTTSLVPHSVSNKLKQDAAKPKASTSASTNKNTSLALNYANSDDSDNEDSGDFFSLNTEDKLPEINASEIKAMVEKKATQMAKFKKNLDDSEQISMETDEYPDQVSSTSVRQRDDINIEALIGARAAKRSRKEDIQFIDISQDQVTSNYDEWQRNQLQSETQFQPTGRLVTGDPGAGTKKKHQITYLAYQAKANEAELQAMWANNRQSRRQTQSKYGF